MNRSPEKILSYLAGNENIDAITVDELKKLVSENPYFPVTQYLLAKKLKGENEAAYETQVQKASLYFSNPYWLRYQLSGSKMAAQAGAQQLAEINSENSLSENEAKTETSAIAETGNLAANIAANEASAIDSTGENILLPDTTEDETPSSTNATESVDALTDETKISTEETTEAEIIQAEEEMAAVERDTNKEAEEFVDHLPPQPVELEHDDAPLRTELSPAAETEVVELKEEMAGVINSLEETTEHFLEDISAQENNNGQPQDDEHDKMFQNIKAMLDASSEEADADTKDAVVPIDPYYTIDYFASQGIKLELDQNPKDQLGQNLKKFTQWLKHMKKLGPEDAAEAINRSETGADIQQIADSSNTVREVVTEAMATVLEKQGKKDKAIELYNKLTFLNPDKSTYFAAKIQKLKGI